MTNSQTVTTVPPPAVAIIAATDLGHVEVAKAGNRDGDIDTIQLTNPEVRHNPADKLVRPTLPDWLTKLTITGLPIGGESVDLLVHRWRGRTSAEIFGRRGSIDVIIHA